MPSTGWAQVTRNVSTPKQFSDALALEGNVTINITADFILNNGHTATLSGQSDKPYNSVYLVAAGKKTINGQKSNGGNYKITRGSYKNNSIVLDNGAWLVIENLILDGDNQPNYASMVVAPPTIKKKINNDDYEDAVNAKLEMRNCTIQKCKQTIVTQANLNSFTVQQTSALNGYNYTFAASGNSGGAGVHFAPGAVASGNIDNKITIENCYFFNNQITEGENTTLENGGALALAGEFARGGTIEGCKFQQNYARNYGGAIWFAPSLKTSNGSFQFLGTTLVGGSVAMKNRSEECGGGIAVEGGYVIFDGKANITYNTTEGDGGGIYASGGKLEFKSSNLDDYIDISYNKATERGGGGICMKSYTNTESASPKLTVIATNTCRLDITNDTAAYGGGICVGETSNIPNDFEYWSADIHFNSGSNDLSSSYRINISNNIAKQGGLTSEEGGGGIFVREKYNVQSKKTQFTKCIVHDNIATLPQAVSGRMGRGGGVLVTVSKPNFDACKIYKNGTTGDGDVGGGVSVTGAYTQVTFNNCDIYDNGTGNNYMTANNSTNTTLTSDGGGVHVEETAGMSVIGCRIYNNKATSNGGGLYMDSENAKLSNGCHVYDNTANQGGGIYYKNGSFENTNYVYNNTATTNGGGVFVEVTADRTLSGLVIGSNVPAANADKGNKAQQGGGVYTYSEKEQDYRITINGCKIVYNQWQSDGVSRITSGGGLCMANENSSIFSFSHTVELTGGTLIDNNKAVNGGGVYLTNTGTLTLELIKTTLSNNIATNNGGGIYNDKQTVTSENNNGTITFHGNSTEVEDGGGIYNNGGIYDNENGQVLLTGTNQHIFTENIAARSGGGIYNNDTCSLKNCQIGQSDKGNEAAAGGGIYVDENATTTLLPGNITFEDNRASSNGGGIYNKGTVTQEDDCTLTFDHNIANKDGGGVYHSGTPLTLTATFTNNTATTGNGGGVYHEGDPLTLTNAIFKNNTATENGGGGIYMNGVKLTINGGWVSHNTATNNGGGIYVKGVEEGALQGGDYRISAFTVLGSNNDTVGWIKPPKSEPGSDHLTGDHVYNVEIGVGNSTIFEWETSAGGSSSGTITFDPDNPEISGFWINVYVNDGQPHIWNDGYHQFIARFKRDGSDDYFELGGNSIDFVNAIGDYGGYEYYDENAQVVPPIVSTTLTLNGSTVGGEAGKGNEATNGDGGGIYIEKKARVIMTSDGSNGTYQEGITNRVTHNKAKRKAGGVYKDGTLQVEGKVIITGNEAGGGSKAGEVPENVYIPTESDDDQTILITGELACGSSIGVTKTKMWDNVNDIPYGDQGEHTYQDDDHLEQVRTAIAKVSPSSPTQTWAENAFHKRIFFDDKGYYRVWSFNYSNPRQGATEEQIEATKYSDQNDYFIETWRSYADADGFNNNTVSTNAGFAYFAKQVNDGFSITSVSQNATIDLAGHYWEPIGYTFCGECGELPHRPFAGTYNGNGHFILNAISILPEKEMGLFGNVTGTVKHTFAVGNLFSNTHDHASNNHGSAGLGAIVGSTTGTIDGCEAAGFTLKGYATATGATVAAGGIAGNVGAGEVRNSFTSGITFTGAITNAGGLVGEIASGGAVKNCYSKAAIPASGTTKGALVGNNSGTLSNAYTSATSGAVVGNGTQGTNVYVYSAGATGATATYTPTIGADHLGYMCTTAWQASAKRASPKARIISNSMTEAAKWSLCRSSAC